MTDADVNDDLLDYEEEENTEQVSGLFHHDETNVRSQL